MAKIPRKQIACLITPGHISSDPRLVKEAIALSVAGMHVHIIFTQYVDYLVAHDKQILNANPAWTSQSLNWTNNTLSSKITRFTRALLQLIMAGNNIKINRNFLWQLKKAASYPADVYIAHNLGALPVAVSAAKKNNAKCGFDAEDFHRNEISDDAENADVKLKTAIEDKYIPQLDYITASSSQIAERYKLLYGRQPVSIVNVFPKTQHLDIINNTDGALQLFWFSQTIGPNRGLEDIIRTASDTGINIDLHLLGKSTPGYKKQLLLLNNKNSLNIHFHQPVAPDDVFKLTAMFDIGLASEPGFSTNNKIALSNKLFTYIQCGLAVVASNTIAQSSFLKQYPEAGRIYDNTDKLANILTAYNKNRDLLYKTKQTNYTLGQTELNWEIESDKFMGVVHQILA